MGIPRLRHAFCVFGDLRMACLALFGTYLLISAFFTNKYIGMNITSRVIQNNPRNLSQKVVNEKNNTYISTSEKGSFAIGTVGSIYLVLSIYGLIGIIAREIYLLIAPIILLPTTAFIMFVLIFFDLGIEESSGFAFFWVFTGFVIKIIMIAMSIYSFLVVYSYYMDVTVGPQISLPTTAKTPSLSLTPKIAEPLKALSEAAKSPSKSETSSEKSPPPKTPAKKFSQPTLYPPKSPPKTPPPKPPTPKIE